MIAAARYGDQYDGILAGDPGFNLPRSRVAEEWDSQALMSIATATDPVKYPGPWVGEVLTMLTVLSAVTNAARADPGLARAAGASTGRRPARVTAT